MDDVPPGYEEEVAVGGDQQADVPPGFDDNEETGIPTAQDAAAPSNGAHENIYQSDLTFNDLGLSKPILDALILDLKFEKPSKIQALTLPKILHERDRHMIAQGHNGCGKTTCFTLAMLMRVNADMSRPQAMCICPTRELVIQNTGVLQKMAARTDPPILVRNTAEQEERIRGQRPPPISEHIIIGTPGTLENWISRRRLPLDGMQVLVFDEADTMLMTEGFKDVSFRMLSAIRKASPDVQILLFSATFNERVREYCNKVVPGATRAFIQKEDLSLDVIKQHKIYVHGPEHKANILQSYILSNANKLGQMIVFVRTRHGADQINRAMQHAGYNCSLLSGEMDKQARDYVVAQFRDMQTRILITTDVLSRGFDVSTVTLVVNYDLPVKHDTCEPDYETYLHRIGRSGRFGNKGAAFNFVDSQFRHRNGRSDEDVMQAIEVYFDRRVDELPANDEDAFIQALEDAGLTTVED